MTERLRLANEQAIDAEAAARNLRESTFPRAEAAKYYRQVTRRILARLKTLAAEGTPLILANKNGRGLEQFSARVRAVLTEIALDTDNSITQGDPDAEK